VTEKDKSGRVVKARTAESKQKPHAGGWWVNTNPLEFAPGDEEATFEYDGGKRTEKPRRKVRQSR
jgi:hypothetical protein